MIDRAPTYPPPPLDAAVKVRLDAETRTALELAAADAGMTLSAYIRRSLRLCVGTWDTTGRE